MRPFHLALPVHDLDAARGFYGGLLGCAEGRSAPRWIDFDFFGHQLSAHLVDDQDAVAHNEVDGDAVPARHFGVVLIWSDWEALGARLTEAGVVFRIEPKVRFRGQVGEQGTFFLDDPSGNALEFKSFQDDAMLFSR
ncbi:MAG: VOC family protein [Proteobacteria bacterium]|nr:VOC family protein [Pseudomonadota bacterium]